MDGAESALSVAERLLVLGNQLGPAALLVLVVVLAWLVSMFVRGHLYTEAMVRDILDELREARRLLRERDDLGRHSLHTTRDAQAQLADVVEVVAEVMRREPEREAERHRDREERGRNQEERERNQEERTRARRERSN